MSRRFGPKGNTHPSVGKPCPACQKPFAAGDYTTIVVLGPGDDPEARERRDDGRAYNAVAVEVHFDCAAAEYRDETGAPQPPVEDRAS